MQWVLGPTCIVAYACGHFVWCLSLSDNLTNALRTFSTGSCVLTGPRRSSFELDQGCFVGSLNKVQQTRCQNVSTSDESNVRLTRDPKDARRRLHVHCVSRRVTIVTPCLPEICHRYARPYWKPLLRSLAKQKAWLRLVTMYYLTINRSSLVWRAGESAVDARRNCVCITRLGSTVSFSTLPRTETPLSVTFPGVSVYVLSVVISWSYYELSTHSAVGPSNS